MNTKHKSFIVTSKLWNINLIKKNKLPGCSSETAYSGQSEDSIRAKWTDCSYWWSPHVKVGKKYYCLLIFRLMDSPFNSNLCEEWTILSKIASATVFSSNSSCQTLTGICEVMMVAFLACLSSMRSSSVSCLCASMVCNPKSSSISRSCFSMRRSSLT